MYNVPVVARPIFLAKYLFKKFSCTRKLACINGENYAQYCVLMLWLEGYAALHKYAYSEPSWISSSDNHR
jgi:hypothetical protein